MSIQDDYFELEEFFNDLVKQDKKGMQPYLDRFMRIWYWGCDCENDNDKLRPIVNGMRNAISLMFDEVERPDKKPLEEDKIEELAFDWGVDYKPWETDLSYREYARHGYAEGYKQAIKDQK